MISKRGRGERSVSISGTVKWTINLNTHTHTHSHSNPCMQTRKVIKWFDILSPQRSCSHFQSNRSSNTQQLHGSLVYTLFIHTNGMQLHGEPGDN